jgi:hypothetical protein
MLSGYDLLTEGASLAYFVSARKLMPCLGRSIPSEKQPGFTCAPLPD